MRPLSSVDIVVIDGDALDAKLAALLLRDAGATVVTAFDAEQGLRVVDARRPRVVVVDLQLGAVSGFVLAKLLSQLKWSSELFIVGASTGNGRSEADALSCGCHAFVQKPFGEQLVTAVVQLVGEAQ